MTASRFDSIRAEKKTRESKCLQPVLCKSGLSVCVCVFSRGLSTPSRFLKGGLGKCSLQKLAKGGKLFLKAPATRQHRDRPGDLPRLPIQLQCSHNPSCPPRLMIAQLVSPSLLWVCTHGLFHTPFCTAGHTSAFPPLVRCFSFSALYVLSQISIPPTPEKSPMAVWPWDGMRMPTPPLPSLPFHVLAPIVGTVFLLSPLSSILLSYPWLSLGLLPSALDRRSCCALSQINNSLHM